QLADHVALVPWRVMVPQIGVSKPFTSSHSDQALPSWSTPPVGAAVGVPPTGAPPLGVTRTSSSAGPLAPPDRLTNFSRLPSEPAVTAYAFDCQPMLPVECPLLSN